MKSCCCPLRLCLCCSVLAAAPTVKLLFHLLQVRWRPFSCGSCCSLCSSVTRRQWRASRRSSRSSDEEMCHILLQLQWPLEAVQVQRHPSADRQGRKWTCVTQTDTGYNFHFISLRFVLLLEMAFNVD